MIGKIETLYSEIKNQLQSVEPNQVEAIERVLCGCLDDIDQVKRPVEERWRIVLDDGTTKPSPKDEGPWHESWDLAQKFLRACPGKDEDVIVTAIRVLSVGAKAYRYAVRMREREAA